MIVRALAMLLGSVLLVASVRSGATSPDGGEERRIEFLIAAVGSLQGAQFIRNGVSYDAKAAADHLRLKRQKAGSRVVTAEDFIRYCASSSSVSGQPYRIRFADGHEVTSEAFLRGQLANYRGQAGAPVARLATG